MMKLEAVAAMVNQFKQQDYVREFFAERPTAYRGLPSRPRWDTGAPPPLSLPRSSLHLAALPLFDRDSLPSTHASAPWRAYAGAAGGCGGVAGGLGGRAAVSIRLYKSPTWNEELVGDWFMV